MATIRKFEDIVAWQRARQLAKEIFLVTRRDVVKYDFSLKDQINGSIGSVMDNIAEGFERDGNKEFIRFLVIAKASAGETRSQWYRMLDRNYITTEEYKEVLSELHGIAYLISRLITYLQKSKFKGNKFHKRNAKPDSQPLEPEEL